MYIFYLEYFFNYYFPLRVQAKVFYGVFSVN